MSSKLADEDKPVLVIDIGGTKLAAGVMLADNKIHFRQETPTLAQQGAEAVLARVGELGRRVLAAFATSGPASDSPVAAVGVASGGQIDTCRGQVNFATDSLPGWSGLPLGGLLTEVFHVPIFVDNDVNCFARGEAALGAGQEFRHLLLVAVGTGVGGGIVIDGKIYSGSQGRAGEVGQICVQPVDGSAGGGNLSGCLEFNAATRVIVANSGFDSIQTLASHYRAGADVPAVDEGAACLGHGLTVLAYTLGPEAILIGGSVGLLGPRYLDLVRSAYVAKAMRSYRDIPLLPTQLGADSGLLGAGLMARHSLPG